MPVQAKICGLTTPGTVDAAVAGGAAWVGFVFFPPSPRNVCPDLAARLAARVPPRVGRVGLFVNADDALIDSAVRAAALTAIQLHGLEPPARAAALKARHGVEVWKALPVRTAADVAATGGWRGVVDRVLLDAKPSAGAALPGGNGLRFDWQLLADSRPPLPWMLAGGLDAANLGDAVGVTGARAVDVSSGVEVAPGVKDPQKIAEFLHIAGQL
ncbi:MAG: phosphoribosylanthranilate isomerase [Sphingomonadaceae bacterium]|nr:phosphoribosylanthranilate isomerase [Sphingomonadaceae bacterium]